MMLELVVELINLCDAAGVLSHRVSGSGEAYLLTPKRAGRRPLARSDVWCYLHEVI